MFANVVTTPSFCFHIWLIATAIFLCDSEVL